MQNVVRAQPLLEGVARFLAWWREELWGLVPQRARQALTRAQPSLVIAALDQGFAVFEQVGAETRPVAVGGTGVLTRGQALAALAQTARSRSVTRVGIRLPVSACFSRSVELPSAARGEFRQILNFDLERATPFKLRDVYTAHLVEGEAPTRGKLAVRQLVAKRDAIDPLMSEIGAQGLQVAFVDCWREEPSRGLPLDFLDAGMPAKGGASRLVTPTSVMAVLALGLLVSAGSLALSKYEKALEEVQTRNATMRAEAAAVRRLLERSDTAVADLAQLRQAKLGRIPATQVLEEISRLLPDTVWLNELRIEGDGVDMTGLAKSGAALPQLLERSPIFTDAALSAPLNLDPREDKERFSLRLRIRQPAAPAPTLQEPQN